MEQTARIAMPLLEAGQLQKEVWHNESLLLLDGLVCGLIAGSAIVTPPEPAMPDCWYRVGSGAAGPWAGRDGELAMSTAGGWRFISPFEGLRLRDAADGTSWTYIGGSWRNGVEEVVELRVGGLKVVGPRAASIADPTGGSVVDAEGRETIRSILEALRGHGLIG